MLKQALIHYPIRWKPSGNQAGAKRGIAAGIGDQLRALVQLRDHPDPRRLDLRASMRDPFEKLWVRDFHLNAALKVVMLVDASASMGYVGQVNRMQVVQEIASQLSLSAYRSGDAFGLYLANETLLKNIMLPVRVNRSAWLWVKQQLPKVVAHGKNADGLLQAAALLPQRRSLVFVVSDFRWQAGKLKQLLKALNHHDVVPLVLQDPTEIDCVPKRGIATLYDVETGQTQFVWMRASLKAAIAEARQQHVQAIHRIAKQYGCQPVLIRGQFNPALLTQYFMERHG